MSTLKSIVVSIVRFGITIIVVGLSYLMAHFLGLSDFVACAFAFVVAAVLSSGFMRVESSSDHAQQRAKIGQELDGLRERIEQLRTVMEESSENSTHS